MKFRTFRVIMSKGWTRVLYTVSLLLLPTVVQSQNVNVSFKYRDRDSVRTMRVMYGVIMPKTDDGTAIPLMVLNGNPCPYDTVAARSFDFVKDGRNYEKIAGLIGINATLIDSVKVLDNEIGTAIWGYRGRSGVIEIITKDNRDIQIIELPDPKLEGIRVVYGPPTMTDKTGNVKPVSKARIRWWKFKKKVHKIFR